MHKVVNLNVKFIIVILTTNLCLCKLLNCMKTVLQKFSRHVNYFRQVIWLQQCYNIIIMRNIFHALYSMVIQHNTIQI